MQKTKILCCSQQEAEDKIISEIRLNSQQKPADTSHEEFNLILTTTN
jgi:hypothetical protein